MRYTRTAITQLSRWYKSVLIKCAIFNAAVFIGAVVISGNAEATLYAEIVGNKEVSGDFSGYNGSRPRYEGSSDYVSGEGGVFFVKEGAHLTVTGGTYAKNTTKFKPENSDIYSGGGGGAIATETASGKVGHLTVKGSADNYVEFIENTAASVGGGAIYASSIDVIDYAKFIQNNGTIVEHSTSVPSSVGGGAIYLNLHKGSTNTKISNSVFERNVASYLDGRGHNGGAIYIADASSESYHIDFINDIFTNNITGRGSSGVETDVDNYSYGEGGAIRFSGMVDDSATIVGSEFTLNKAANGGAIYGYNAPNLTIKAGTNADGSEKRTTFEENLATKGGGAILHSGNDLHISDTDFTGNSVIGKSDSKSSVDGGGAIYYIGSQAKKPHIVTIENSTFTNNVVEDRVTDASRLASASVKGGALYLRDGSYGAVTITGTEFKGNSLSVSNRPFEDTNTSKMSQGGAAYIDARNFHGDDLTFDSNTADSGAGLYLLGDDYSVIENSTFLKNIAKYQGGGAYLFVSGNDDLKITGSRFDNNEAQYGGGVYISGGGIVENSIITNNKASKLGGGIYSGTLIKVKDSEIAYNSAPSGAAIYDEYSGVGTSKISLDNVKIHDNKDGSTIKGRTVYFVNSDIYDNNAGDSDVLDISDGILIDTDVVNNKGNYSLNLASGYTFLHAIDSDVVIDNPGTKGINAANEFQIFAADDRLITIKDSFYGILAQYDGVVNYEGDIIKDPNSKRDGFDFHNGVANINGKMDTSIYQLGGVLNLNTALEGNHGLTIEGDAVANLSKDSRLSFLYLNSNDGALVNINGNKDIDTLTSFYSSHKVIDTTLDKAITAINIGTYKNSPDTSAKEALHLNLDADFSTGAIDNYTIDNLKIISYSSSSTGYQQSDIAFSVDSVNNLSSTDLSVGESKKFKFLKVASMSDYMRNFVRIGLGRINDTEMTEYYADKSYNYSIDDSDFGTISLTRGNGLSLKDAIASAANSKTYTFQENYKNSAPLGSFNGEYLGINAEGYGMDGRDSANNYAEGIT